jgi:hypothetical protein
MKKLLTITVLLVMLFSVNISKGAEIHWGSVRTIVQAYRDICTLVESSITFINTYNPSPGSALHVTSGLDGKDFEECAVKLSNSTGGYAYLLEVWTKRGGTWYKGMEYNYNDGNSGEIILNPYAFDSINYTDGSLHRIVFNHSTKQKDMTVYSVHSPAVNTVERSIGTATEVVGFVDLYFTAHLNQDFDVSGTNDAYLFGARISTVSPYYCTAKQGICDQGATYDFTAYGIPHGLNAGLFTNSGFIDDGKAGGGNYSPESNVVSSNLPSATIVNGFTVSFQSVADPDFI